MIRLFLKMCCFFCSIGLFAQNKYYEKVLPLWADIHEVMSVVTLSDSTFIIAGNYTYYSPLKSTAYIAKIDKNAAILWQTLFSSAGENAVFDVIEGNFDHYATTGTLAEDYIENSINTMCSYFVNDAGYLQSLSNYGVTTSDSRSYRIIRSADGGYLSVGYLVNGGYPDYTLYAVKLGPDGSKEWQKIYPIFNSHCTFRDVMAAPDGGYYLTGSVNMNWNDFPFDEGNILLMKIDSTGNVEWSKVHNVGSMDQGLSFKQTADGGFIIGGASALAGNQIFRPYLLKTDSVGNFVWGKQYFIESGRGEIVNVAVLPTGGYLITGSYGPNFGIEHQLQAFMVRTDEDGNSLWYRIYGNPTNSFGGNAHDYVYDMTPTLDGGYMIVGRKDSMLSESEGYAYAWLVKTNCMGLLTVPKAQFTLTQDPDFLNRFLFTNQSQYAYPDSIDGGYYVLNWGDGSPPYLCGQGYAPCTQDTLIHTYQTEGIYGVTLHTIVCNDTSTQIQSVCFGFAPNPQAEFSYQDFGGAIIFTNLSQNSYLAQGGYYVWDFGDGSPPVSAEHPTHEYEENGSYTVTLTLVVCGDTSMYSQDVVVQTVGNPPQPLQGGELQSMLQVYPNPTQNTLTFQWVSKSPSGDLGVNNGFTPPSGGWGVTGDLGVKLLSLTGQTVLQTTLAAGETNKTVSVAHLPEGVYVYVVEDGSVVLARGKVAVVR
ncbi:MAG: PKD domain-containing protein [Sphingobacteriales bacterium]|nr:MAG: PKD domain-containing protein [Sphingobacteriales bacterium]